MALSRIKVWIPGDVLTAADLNAEFNNLLNNPITLVSPTTGAINFSLLSHTNLVPTAITASSGSIGQVLSVSTGGTPAWITGVGSGASRVRQLYGFISSQNGSVFADEYVMRSSAGAYAWTVSATSSFSANLGTAGPTAGGRDQAGAFASTYIHFYAISTGVGSTQPQGIWSSQPETVGPTLPTSYSGWTYLGTAIYSSSSTTVPNDQYFEGSRGVYASQFVNGLVNGGASTSITPITISSAVPGNARVFMVRYAINTTVSASSLQVNGSSTYWGMIGAVQDSFVIVPQTSQGLSYQNSTGGGSISILLNGYSMPNGDA